MGFLLGLAGCRTPPGSEATEPVPPEPISLEELLQSRGDTVADDRPMPAGEPEPVERHESSAAIAQRPPPAPASDSDTETELQGESEADRVADPGVGHVAASGRSAVGDPASGVEATTDGTDVPAEGVAEEGGGLSERKPEGFVGRLMNNVGAIAFATITADFVNEQLATGAWRESDGMESSAPGIEVMLAAPEAGGEGPQSYRLPPLTEAHWRMLEGFSAAERRMLLLLLFIEGAEGADSGSDLNRLFAEQPGALESIRPLVRSLAEAMGGGP